MKQVIALSVALTAALVGSYLTWTDDSEPVSTEGAVIVRATPDEIDSIEWSDGTRELRVTKRSDDLGEYYWFESKETKETTRPVEPPPASPVDGEDPPPPETETITEEIRVAFAGNGGAKAVWEGFAPLDSLRELTGQQGLDLELFGLTEPSGTLTITRSGKANVISVGTETYGTKDRYAKLDDRVFLLDDGDLRPLEFATSRLVERDFHPFEEKDIDAIRIVRGSGESLTVVQKNPDDEAKRYWARSESPEEHEDAVDTLVGRLQKLRLRAYVDEADVPELQPLFQLEFVGDGKTYPVEFFATGTDKFYAKSAFNRSYVSLTDRLALTLAEEIDEVMAVD